LDRRRREISTKWKKDTILTERSQELTEIKGVGFFKSPKQTVIGLQETHFKPKNMAGNRRFVPSSRHRDRGSGGALFLLATRLAVRMVRDFGRPAGWAFPKQILSANRAGGSQGPRDKFALRIVWNTRCPDGSCLRGRGGFFLLAILRVLLYQVLALLEERELRKRFGRQREA
jgi:hypothetical protein